jgi:hypothetical protein
MLSFRWPIALITSVLGVWAVLAVWAPMSQAEDAKQDNSSAVSDAKQDNSSPISDGNAISFTKQIKPIFDTKCVSCHACYDAPGQLDLRSAKGIRRGAMKIDTYAFREDSIAPTFVWNSPNTLDDWRKMGFFSVTEGGRDSIMSKLLALGHANPVKPNAQFPADIKIDQLERKNHLPNKYEIDGYAEQFPKQGMPLAVSGLTDEEHEAIMSWLEDGAPIDHEAAEPTAKELAQIQKWEEFLNANDKRSRLVARYFFEHLSLVNFLFEDRDDANSFILVRSTTPSGEDTVPVYQHIANKEVDGEFYYRFQLLELTDCVKNTRLQLLASDKKLGRFKNIFYEEDWSVDQLPGYTDSERFNPLVAFRAIPARARWRFNLANSWYLRGQISMGPSCHGNVATAAVRDVGWDIFESPETSLYVTDPQYRAEVDPLLSEMINPSNLLNAFIDRYKYVKQHKEFKTRALARAKEVGYRSNFNDIWRGEHPDDQPLVSFVRHDDNAYVVEGRWVPFEFPKTINVFDLPSAESALYSAVINFDLYGPGIWSIFGAREQFGLTRVDTELNFLRFLPRKVRSSMWKSWYLGELSEERWKMENPDIAPDDTIELSKKRWKMEDPNIAPDDTIPTDIKYSTDDPKREFYERLLEYMGSRVNANDPINRPKAGDDADRITKALISIVAASREQEPTWRKFKTFLPEAVFLRIDRSGQEPGIYTMTHDRDYATKAFITTSLQDDIPGNAKVAILEGAYTAYPNFMFRINEDEIEKFAASLIDADTQKKFTAIVERWGIRRSSPDFWPVLNSVTAYVERTNPSGAPQRAGGRAGTFDINRYKNL